MTTREEEMAAAIEGAELDDLDEGEGHVYFSVPPASVPSQVYSIRIPVDRLEQLRQVAENEGHKPTVLMREWVLEKLDAIQTEPAGPPKKQVVVSIDEYRLPAGLRNQNPAEFLRTRRMPSP